MFLSLDKDGGGTIGLDEMQEGIEKAGGKDTDSLLEIMRGLDSDGSGQIDYTEFLAATISRKHYQQEDVLWAAFRVFDLDGNGKITKEELAQVLQGGQAQAVTESMGLQAKEVEDIIKEVDDDGDGEIDFN